MSNYSTPKFFAFTLGPGILALTAAALWGMSVLDRLPVDTATHFDLSGNADDFMSPFNAVFIPILIGVIVTAALAIAFVSPTTRRGNAARWLAGTTAGTPVFMAALVYFMTSLNLDMESGRNVTLPASSIIIPLAMGIVVGLLVALTITPAPPLPSEAGKPAGARGDHGRDVHVPAGAKASWFGYARPGKTLLAINIFSILTMVIVTVMVPEWWMIALTIATIILVLGFSFFKVSISTKGLRAGSIVGWPQIAIPLSEVSSAEVSDVHFGNWGGWGWRVSSQGTGLITGGEEALRVTRTNGKILEVTCNDPATAAGVIRALKAN